MSSEEVEPGIDDKASLSASSDHGNDTDNVAQDNDGVCPFVCGICYEKFDKISPFYAHLRTHGRFDNVEMNKKNDMLKALNVRDKLDENIFKCGLCNVYFPSMSLLHDHMVLEENIKDYHYSNEDHTATPNKKVFDVKLARVIGPTKSLGKNNSGSPIKRKVCFTNKTLREKRKRKNIDEADADFEMVDNDDKNETESEHSSEPKSKRKAQSEQGNKPSAESEDSVTIGTRASSRLSRDGSRKRVDYKALAGIVSPKREIEEIAKVTETKKTSILNAKDKKVHLTKDSGRKTRDTTDDINDDEVEGQITDLNESQSTKQIDREQVINGEISEEDINELDSDSDNVNEIEEDAVGDETSEPTNHVKTQTEILKEDGTHDNEHSISDYQVFQIEYINGDGATYQYNLDDTEDFDDDADDDFALPEKQEEYLRNHDLKSRKGRRKKGEIRDNNRLYPCRVCGKYMMWRALKKHYFAHVKERSVQCKVCNKMYKSKRHLSDHMRSVHTMMKYKCGHCGYILKGKQGFEKHASMHIIKKEVVGSIEDVKMIEVSDKEYWEAKEKQSKSSKNSFTKREFEVPEKEDSCEQPAEDVNDDTGPLHGEHLELDSELVGSTSNIDCRVCAKRFSSHEALVKHLLEHNVEERHQCEICQAYFQTGDHLDHHIVEQHGQNAFKCEICGEKFKSFYVLRSHRSKHLQKTDKYYSEETVKKLQEINELEKDVKKSVAKVKINTKKKPCPICGMYVRSNRIKRHMEVHTDTKEFQCEICHKFYKTRRYLIDHRKKTHFADITTCDICGQTFKGRTYLETHRQIHGPRDKQCPYCDKAFTTVMYLRAHLLTHQEKKQFKCDMCPSAFSHRQRLHIHMTEIHNQGDNRPCTYCGEMFPSREKARKHERRVHEGVEPYKRPKHGTSHTSTDNSVQLLEINVPEEGVATTTSNKPDKKIVQFISPAVSSSALTTIRLSSGIKSEESSSASSGNVPHIVQNDLAFGDKQFIKLDNGEEYQVMLEEGGEQLEVIELSEEQHNVFIQETSEPTDVVEAQSNDSKEEQVLEIPENAEQCQILLFPDGSFKLLNVVDNTTVETSQ